MMITRNETTKNTWNGATATICCAAGGKLKY